MEITRNQWIAIVILILSVNMGATAQLTDLFGPYAAKLVVSFSSIGASILAGVQIILGGQSTQIKDVRSMPGVEHIEVNEHANATLAAIAVDPDEPKISAAPRAQAAVIATAAKGD